MKWKVEYIGSQANILIDDESKSDMDKDPVGMGFPIKLAENIVKLHNEAIEELEIKCNRLQKQIDDDYWPHA